MTFSINSVILWSRHIEGEIRTVKFAPNSVNILTGASQTGKSAIIPIIDYCLGAGDCTILVGIIRNSCDWFGVLVDLDGEQMLICRRGPEAQKSTNDMYLARGKVLTIPKTVVKNITLEQVKNTLNGLFDLTLMAVDPSASDNFGARPSYRDLMAFVFQPQNL